MTQAQEEKPTSIKPHNLSTWDIIFRWTAGISFVIAIGQLFIPTDFFHKRLFRSKIESTFTNNFDDLKENIKSKLVIRNNGNMPERNLSVSVTMIDGAEIGISNLQSVDTTQRSFQYGLKEVLIKSNQFLPEDSLIVTFNTNAAQLDTFQKYLTLYKIDYYNPIQPNISYIKGADRSFSIPSISLPKK